MNAVSRWGFSLSVAAVLVCGWTAFAAEPPAGGIKWQTDLNVAHRLSQQTGKPMLFVFGADWCTWCKKLEKTTLTDRELVAYINANFVPIHIDADRDPRVVQILEAEGLPCAVVLSPNADLLGRIEGFRDAAAYRTALATAKQGKTAILPVAGRR
jgi:thioredoxin-like negative regulator of GroEL